MRGGKQEVSWVDGHGHRVFGTFSHLDPADKRFVICRTKTGWKARILEANLTYEMG